MRKENCVYFSGDSLKTAYICGFDPYKKVGWFKRLLVRLGIIDDPNIGSFTLLTIGDSFKDGDAISSGYGVPIYIYKKLK